MGGVLSSTSSTEPSSTNPTTHSENSSSQPPPPPTVPGDSRDPIPSPGSTKPADMPPSDPNNPTEEQRTTAEESDQSKPAAEKEEEEEEGECGFCLFMKGGGCKDAFIAWEVCVKDADNEKADIVDKCSEITRLLKVCLDEHSDYYEPILRAEKEAEKQARKEMREEEEQRKAAAAAAEKEGDKAADVATGSRSEVITVEKEEEASASIQSASSG